MVKGISLWAVAILLLGIGLIGGAHPVLAVDFTEPCGSSCAEINPPKTLAVSARNIINTTLQVLGGVAVIMVIVGGIRMAASHGDPSQIKAGRETILYSVVGIIVAVASYVIVNFVIKFNW